MHENRYSIKRKADLQIISSWITEGQSVLDLGCGRGLFLEHLQRTKHCQVVGVDLNSEKVLACVQRGVPVYQGDITKLLAKFEDQYFDWVVCSRTLQELETPSQFLLDTLRVGKRVAVGFANYGYWVNRWAMLTSGQRALNDVYPNAWHESRPINPVSVESFQGYCRQQGIQIEREIFLAGDWKSPTKLWPNLFAGYGLFCLRIQKSIHDA